MQIPCKLDASQHLLCAVLGRLSAAGRVPCVLTKVRDMSPVSWAELWDMQEAA